MLAMAFLVNREPSSTNGSSIATATALLGGDDEEELNLDFEIWHNK
jgi:hypothetical protein